MTRDAEHTPSPQSVVVPDPLWMMHVIGPDDIYPAPDHATAVQWCAYLNSEIAPKVPSVLCVAVPAIWTGTAEEHAEGLAEAIKGWTVPAAPAPSSLAGGWRSPTEVPEANKGEHAYRIVAVKRADGEKVVTFSAFYMNAVPLWFEDDNESRNVTGWHSDSEGDDGPTYSPLLMGGDVLMGWREFPQWEAALSPEAPAREEWDVHQTIGPIDFDKLRSIIHSATNAALPFANAPMKTPFSTKERAGMQVEIADLIVADLEKAGGRAPALTPRHEAPASRLTDALNTASAKVAENPERAAEIRANWTDGHEAPAEGAGDLTTERVLARICDAQKRHYGNATALHLAMLDLCIDGRAALALRARSSAPEAREVLERIREMDFKAIYGEANYQKLADDLDALYTHPAALSADKLRIAVEALEKIKTGRATVTECSLIARRSLAALKAEGC